MTAEKPKLNARQRVAAIKAIDKRLVMLKRQRAYAQRQLAKCEKQESSK